MPFDKMRNSCLKYSSVIGVCIGKESDFSGAFSKKKICDCLVLVRNLKANDFFRQNVYSLVLSWFLITVF